MKTKKSSSLLLILTTLLSLFCLLPASADWHMEVKTVVNAGPGEHPVYKDSFTALGSAIAFSPTQATSVDRVVFGLCIHLKDDAGNLVSGELKLSENPGWVLYKNGAIYKTGFTSIFNNPLPAYAPSSLFYIYRSSRPDLIMYNTAGNITSVDFASATSTALGSTLVFGDVQISLGTQTDNNGNVTPSPHTRMNVSGDSYAMAFTLKGSAMVNGVTKTIDINPGNSPNNYAIAKIVSESEWVSKLKDNGLTSVKSPEGKTTISQTFIDYSNMPNGPGAFSLAGFQSSTDLIHWAPFTSSGLVYNEVQNGITVRVIKISAELTTENRRFFRGFTTTLPL